MRKDNIINFPNSHVWQVKDGCDCDHCCIERRNIINERHSNFISWVDQTKADKDKFINVLPSILRLGLKLKASILLTFFLECYLENDNYPFPILKTDIREIISFSESELRASLKKLVSYGYVRVEDAESPPCGDYLPCCKQYSVNLDLIHTQLDALGRLEKI